MNDQDIIFIDQMSVNLQRLFARLWPWSITAYTLLSLILLFMPVFGVNNEAFLSFVPAIAAFLFVPILLSIIGGFAYDIQRQARSNQYIKK